MNGEGGNETPEATQETVEQPAQKAPKADLEKVARAMGLIFTNATVYGMTHGVTLRNVRDAYALLSSLLEAYGGITVSTTEEDLLMNGETFEPKNALVRTLRAQISQLGAADLTINPEITEEEFCSLVEVMLSEPEEADAGEGFVRELASRGLTSITAKRVTYREIAEDEMVVTKGAAEAEADGKGGDGGQALTEEAEQKIREIEEAVAFLKGTGVVGEGEPEKPLPHLPGDGEDLAELIVEVSELSRTSPEDQGDGTLAGAAVQCLRRSFQALSADPSAKTQKGKKALSKTLQTAGKSIVERIKGKGQDLSEEQAEAIAEAVDELTDELKIDALADEYVKKRKAIEANEGRIVRFIKARGQDGLSETGIQERLEQAGLSSEGWSELLARSGVAGGPGGPSAAEATAMQENLAKSVAEMQRRFPQAFGTQPGGEGDADALAAVAQVSRDVAEIAAQAEMVLSRLEEEAKIEAETPPEKKDSGRMTRRRLFEILAEMGQEFCQPLAVINCSLEMIRSGCLGEAPMAHLEMLHLANASAESLQRLVSKLVEIAGVPSGRRPDKQIQDSLHSAGA
ncbi:hypothetical protein ACFLSJ_01680 [Verrucomicrobiota bacterium]